MILRFRTESNSLYKLDSKTMTWERTYKGKEAGELRSESGKLMRWPQINMYEPAVLTDGELKPGCDIHYIRTSAVREISKEGKL